jgi:hypothetical protein
VTLAISLLVNFVFSISLFVNEGFVCFQHLVEINDVSLEKALPTCYVYQLLFNFFELQMPLVLSPCFYEPQPPSVDKLAVACWLATRCSLIEVPKEAVNLDDLCHYDSLRLLEQYKVPSNTFAVPSSQFTPLSKCCTACNSFPTLLPAYCTLLQAYVANFSGWLAPKEFCPAQDMIKTAFEFIENPHVISQFSVNYTLRQQWLALSLATLQKVCR